jgi:hypothetical protein
VTRSTWLVVGGVLLLGAAATADALRDPGEGGEKQSPAAGTSATVAVSGPFELDAPSEPDPIPRCGRDQLDLELARVEGGGIDLVLINRGMSVCRTPRLRAAASLFDRNGRRIDNLFYALQPFARATAVPPNGGASAHFAYAFLCTERRPVAVVAEVGPYAVRALLPRKPCHDDLGP